MKRIFAILLLTATLLIGCGFSSEEEFNDFAGEFYVQMFTDGDQTEEVNAMYSEFTSNFSEYEDSELYEAIVGMYHGLKNGVASKFQVKAMHLFNVD